jgi:hypothetical protein
MTIDEISSFTDVLESTGQSVFEHDASPIAAKATNATRAFFIILLLKNWKKNEKDFKVSVGLECAGVAPV